MPASESPSGGIPEESHRVARQTLNDILDEFDIYLPNTNEGPEVLFTGAIPPPAATHSQKLNLSLVGSIPALANAVAAAQIFEARGGARQTVTIDLRRGHNYIDPGIGMTPTINGQEIPYDVVAGNPFLNNIFETKDDRYAVLSAVKMFAKQSSGGVRLADDPIDLENLASEAGMPMAICESEESWAKHPQGEILSKLPWVPAERIPVQRVVENSPWAAVSEPARRPLSGIKVLCLTHAIAGPSAGRTLAEHGASVLQVMFTHGFEHHFVYTYANLGTASARLDLYRTADRERLRTLVKEAHVWVDSFRPQAISKFGFSDEDIFALNPSMIIARTRVYGSRGPWAHKPGFDMQGSASSGMMVLCGQGIGNGQPQWPPGMVINDYTTGYATALAIQSILLKRFRGEVPVHDGWSLRPSLCGTAMGILKYFKTSRFPATPDSGDEICRALPPETMQEQTKLGYLKTLAPLPQMSATPLCYELGLLVPMGSSKPVFPGYDDGYDIKSVAASSMDQAGLGIRIASATEAIERLREMGEEWRVERNFYKA